MTQAAQDTAENRPSFRDLFTPKLVTVLREGYGARELRADAFAGLSVAVVALPLSMAIAIASGVEPARGLYAAIIGGFVVSLLGGSRFQIGGPAGAFIILVAATAARHGLDGLLLATFLSGMMLTGAGYLRLGSYVRLIPYPVTIGFTAGIAIIIFASQIKDLLGLTIESEGAHDLAASLGAAYGALDTLNAHAVGVAVLTIATILAVKRYIPKQPSVLIGVIATTLVATALHLPVETIALRFGDLPSTLPSPQLPDLTFEKIAAVLPDAFAFALLGAIESLLSATVADGMTGRRHRSNCELVAQGAANIAASIFGGIVVTGAIARTATNIRAGAHGPVAGIMHAAFLLLFMVTAAPLASFIPLAALAGVLAIVAYDMIDRGAMFTLLRTSKGDAAALSATLLLTIFRDLTLGIVAGVAIGALSFINRMSEGTSLRAHAPLLRRDEADGRPETRAPYESPRHDVAVYRVTGALFFGSAASLAAGLERILAGQRALILDFSEASIVDSTGAHAISGFVAKATKRGIMVRIAGASPQIKHALEAGGLSRWSIGFDADLESALRQSTDVMR